MQSVVINLMPLARGTCIVTLMLIPLAGSAGPAQAQDFLGFLKSLLPPALQNAFDPPYSSTRSPVHRSPQVVGVDQPVIERSLKPKALGEVTKAVPDLLADSTLQYGDIVMFPDGPRAFIGGSGTQHALTDFEPAARAGSAVSASTRKLVAVLRPGSSSAWDAD